MTASALSRNRDFIVAGAVIVASILIAAADHDLLAHFTVSSLIQVVLDELHRFLAFFLS